MASVEIQTPDGVLRVRLDRDHFTIGRLTTNDIALPFSHISRQHAELRLQGQTWWVVDLRSTNGLHVSGQRVGECRLVPGATVMLSPLISLTMLEETAPPAYPRSPAYPQPQMVSAPPQPMAAYPQAQMAQPQMAQPQMTPSRHSVPLYPPATPASEPITPLSALGPHSPYSDDETPFYPQMRPVAQPYAAQPYAAQSAYAPSAPAAMATHPAQYRAQYAPALAAPMPDMSASVFDPQRQPAQVFEQRRTANAAPSPLLHVCQTCGQRTQPDAVYCQNCHHSIANECMRCRLSLLPIQDICPRCQTPNPSSVRRTRRTVGPA